MRRGAARSAAAKVRMGTSDRSSPAPFVGGSDNGDSDNESLSGKKGKSELQVFNVPGCSLTIQNRSSTRVRRRVRHRRRLC